MRLLIRMFSEYAKGCLCVANCGSRKEKLPPQFVIHGVVILRVETTDSQCQLARKQDLGLHDVAICAPDRSYPDQILQRMHATAMREKNFSRRIYNEAES